MDVIKMKFSGGHNWRIKGRLQECSTREDQYRTLDFLHDEADYRSGENTMICSEIRTSHDTIQEMVRELKELVARFRVIRQRNSKPRPASELMHARWILAVASPLKYELGAKIVDL